MGGGGGHGQTEHEVKVDGVRTEYLYGRHSTSHYNMSLDFEYADEYVDIDLSAGAQGHSSQSSGEVLLPDGRTIETTRRSASASSHSDLVVTVMIPFGGITLPYTLSSHTSSSWSLGGEFSMGLVRDAFGNISRYSPQIADFVRTDTSSFSSTRTDATGTSTSDSETVTTTTGGGGGDSLNQNWTSESSWSHTPASPSGGGGSGGGSGGGEPTGGSSGGGGGGAVEDVPGFLGGQIDTGTPGTAVSPGQAMASVYNYLASLYGPDPATWPAELRERLFGHEHEDGYVADASSQGWNQYAWVMDLYNSLYSNRPGTEGTPVDVRGLEEIGSGGGIGEPEPYEPFVHSIGSPGLMRRDPVDDGSQSGSGSIDDAMPLWPGFSEPILLASNGLPPYLIAALVGATSDMGHHHFVKSLFTGAEPIAEFTDDVNDFIWGYTTPKLPDHKRTPLHDAYNAKVREIFKYAIDEGIIDPQTVTPEQMKGYIDELLTGKNPFTGKPETLITEFLEKEVLPHTGGKLVREGTIDQYKEWGRSWRMKHLNENVRLKYKNHKSLLEANAPAEEIKRSADDLGRTINDRQSLMRRGIQAGHRFKESKYVKLALRFSGKAKVVPIVGGAFLLIDLNNNVQAHGIMMGTARSLPVLGDIVTIGVDGTEIAKSIAEINAIYADELDRQIVLDNAIRDKKIQQLLQGIVKEHSAWQYSMTNNDALNDGLAQAISELQQSVGAAVRFQPNDPDGTIYVDSATMAKAAELFETRLRELGFEPPGRTRDDLGPYY